MLVRPFGIILLLISLCSSWPFASTPAFAQSAVQPRITKALDESQLTTLPGNVHPLARPEFDRGPAPPDLPMPRMLLVLQRSAEQEAALQRLLDDQQDKASPSFHRWLTPEDFGQQFGPADQDLQTVTAWLQSHGFQVARVSKGRTVVEFSGTAAQVQEAFHTAIHKFTVDGEDHWANASDPQIPTALTPVVAGVNTLHNFLKKPEVRFSAEGIEAQVVPAGPGKTPQVTFPGSPAIHAIGPGDFATIYNLPTAIGGTGASIAVVARSNFDPDDLSDFWRIFSVPGGFNTILDGPDPGNLGGDEELEALLDATWATASAPAAFVERVVSASTNTTDGVDLSELYIIDNNLAGVMTESFGECEAFVTQTEAAGIAALSEQAAAQGITYLVSTGDTGAEGCDANSATVAQGPVSANVLAATPFTVAVGGTLFNENGQDSKYWSSTNTQGNTLSSALSYIPETAWNESCSAAQCGQSANIRAGGGGASTFFSKPSWQSAVTGIPSDSARDIPDVSLTAASHDPYLLCLHRSCENGPGGSFEVYFVWGTSVAAPSFAGIVARLASAVTNYPQFLTAAPRLGQINYVLYKLAAAENLSQCNASSTNSLPASTCVFNDVTKGNIVVPGETGTQYQSAVGYDLATGLGSVNVTNLINAWNAAAFHATTTTLSLNSGNAVNVVHGAPVSVSVEVSSSNGTPTGDVSLTSVGDNPQNNYGISRMPLSSGSISTSTNLLPGGFSTIIAHYAGDGVFAPSDSEGIYVTVTSEPSTTAASAFTADSKGNPILSTGGPYGSFIYLRADVTGASGFGIPTGSVTFSDSLGANVGSFTLNSQGNTATPNGIFTLGVGTHVISASYGGDVSFKASTSPPLNLTTTQASTSTTATAAANMQGAGAVLTAAIATPSYGNPPTGTVTFSSGSTQLGSAPVVGGMNPTNGTAQATVSWTDAQLASGQYNVTATYSGDTNYSGSSSTPASLNLQPDFSLSFSTAIPSVSVPGGVAFDTLTISTLDGFSGTLNFTAASCSGLPTESSCSFNPASVTGSGTTQLTITTTGPHQAALKGTSLSRNVNPWMTSLGLAVTGIFLIAVPIRRRRWPALFSLLILAFVITLPGCGGGSGGGGGGGSGGGGGGGGQMDPGTPVGAYTVTVTVTSGSLTHSTTFQLTVQ